jgi:hypothetical protein
VTVVEHLFVVAVVVVATTECLMAVKMAGCFEVDHSMRPSMPDL